MESSAKLQKLIDIDNSLCLFLYLNNHDLMKKTQAVTRTREKMVKTKFIKKAQREKGIYKQFGFILILISLDDY